MRFSLCRASIAANSMGPARRDSQTGRREISESKYLLIPLARQNGCPLARSAALLRQLEQRVRALFPRVQRWRGGPAIYGDGRRSRPEQHRHRPIVTARSTASAIWPSASSSNSSISGASRHATNKRREHSCPSCPSSAHSSGRTECQRYLESCRLFGQDHATKPRDLRQERLQTIGIHGASASACCRIFRSRSAASRSWRPPIFRSRRESVCASSAATARANRRFSRSPRASSSSTAGRALCSPTPMCAICRRSRIFPAFPTALAYVEAGLGPADDPHRALIAAQRARAQRRGRPGADSPAARRAAPPSPAFSRPSPISCFSTSRPIISICRPSNGSRPS